MSDLNETTMKYMFTCTHDVLYIYGKIYITFTLMTYIMHIKLL